MAWDPNQFSNTGNYDQNFYTSQPVYTQNYGYNAFDPRLHGVTTSGGGTISNAVPVLNTIVNPVENLNSRIPIPTLVSPVDGRSVQMQQSPFGTMDPSMDQGQPQGMDPNAEDAMCCGSIIPHFELRQTRENLGLNQAQRSRYGTSAGEGISLASDHERIAPSYGDPGPVDTSDPTYTAELYDQGFVSMSGVPSVYVGVFTDPLTGEEFDAYESMPPPPDADYEETLTAPGRDVKLAMLQGGVSANTPRPTRVELLEDDFHMQYDRSINSFGTYDPSRYIEAINHNNRLNHDDAHPYDDGPIITGTPANVMGNQGTVKVRYMPYTAPTNRGKWEETTFRSGIDSGQQGAGGGAQRLDHTYTTIPYDRAESNRTDGGGIDGSSGNYQGFMDQYGGAPGYDHNDTQRTVSEPLEPLTGPVDTGGSRMNYTYGTIAPPTSTTGTTELGLYGIGNMTGDALAPKPTDQIVPTQHTSRGTQSSGTYAVGPAQGQPGLKLMNGEFEVNVAKSGITTNPHTNWGAEGTSAAHGSQLNGGVRTNAHKTKREALARVQSMMDAVSGTQTAAPTQALRTRFSDKSGHLVDFMMPGGNIGGTESLRGGGAATHGSVTNPGEKREKLYDYGFGANPSAASYTDSVVYGQYGNGDRVLTNAREGGVPHLPHPANAGMAIGFRDTSETVGR